MFKKWNVISTPQHKRISSSRLDLSPISNEYKQLPQKEVFALIDRMADGRCICARLSTFTGNATTECFCRFLFFFSWCNIRSLVDVGVCMCLPEERIQCLGIYTFAFLRLGLAFLRTPFLAGAFLPLFPFLAGPFLACGWAMRDL